jgi:hypothetical protein
MHHFIAVDNTQPVEFFRVVYPARTMVPVFPYVKTLTPNEQGHWPLVVFGDMHACDIKMIRQLFEYGFINDRPETRRAYQLLWNLFHTRIRNEENGGLTYFPPKSLQNLQDYISDFDACVAVLMQNLNTDNKSRITYAGDMLADRHGHGRSILKLVSALSRQGSRFSILFSNHDLEAFFLEMGLKNTISCVPQTITSSYSIYENDRAFAKAEGDLELFADHDQLMRDYCAHIELLSYIISERKDDDGRLQQAISLLTHAPTAFCIIEKLAQCYNIPYRDYSVEALADTIDTINKVFREDLLLKDGSLNKAFLKGLHSAFPANTFDIHGPMSKEKCIIYCAWNRKIEDEKRDRPEAHVTSHLDRLHFYGHGHDNTPVSNPHVLITDNSCAKNDFRSGYSANTVCIKHGRRFSTVLERIQVYISDQEQKRGFPYVSLRTALLGTLAAVFLGFILSFLGILVPLLTFSVTMATGISLSIIGHKMNNYWRTDPVSSKEDGSSEQQIQGPDNTVYLLSKQTPYPVKNYREQSLLPLCRARS